MEIDLKSLFPPLTLHHVPLSPTCFILIGFEETDPPQQKTFLFYPGETHLAGIGTLQS